MNSAHFTQLLPASSTLPSITYKLLDGNWPVLGSFPPVPDCIFERMIADASGTAITTHLHYLSLGLFFIDTKLLKAHPTQRPLNQTNVEKLSESFKTCGIHRMNSPGVVIGLGNGWLQMKNRGSHFIKITKSSPHIHRLAAEPGGPVAHVIRGGHRTEAIRRYALSSKHFYSYEDFWLYHVLAPGVS
jgi:hypothetical protein